MSKVLYPSYVKLVIYVTSLLNEVASSHVPKFSAQAVYEPQVSMEAWHASVRCFLKEKKKVVCTIFLEFHFVSKYSTTFTYYFLKLNIRNKKVA